MSGRRYSCAKCRKGFEVPDISDADKTVICPLCGELTPLVPLKGGGKANHEQRNEFNLLGCILLFGGLIVVCVRFPWGLLVGAVLFVCGVICMATKRNGIGVLMGVELVLNGANVNFVAFSKFTSLGLDGQVFSLFIIVLAAAEAAVALAIALNFYNNHLTIDVDRGNKLKG